MMTWRHKFENNCSTNVLYKRIYQTTEVTVFYLFRLIYCTKIMHHLTDPLIYNRVSHTYELHQYIKVVNSHFLFN